MFKKKENKYENFGYLVVLAFSPGLFPFSSPGTFGLL
jgi:hypothetical protein